jgi:hypothetical protein
VSSELTLEVCYYNERLAVWEPLIEPVETDMRHRPWEISIDVSSMIEPFTEFNIISAGYSHS